MLVPGKSFKPSVMFARKTFKVLHFRAGSWPYTQTLD